MKQYSFLSHADILILVGCFEGFVTGFVHELFNYESLIKKIITDDIHLNGISHDSLTIK
jgi:hypothetical protein